MGIERVASGEWRVREEGVITHRMNLLDEVIKNLEITSEQQCKK